MRCPQCHTENRAHRKFCAVCGQALVLACPVCGFVWPDVGSAAAAAALPLPPPRTLPSTSGAPPHRPFATPPLRPPRRRSRSFCACVPPLSDARPGARCAASARRRCPRFGPSRVWRGCSSLRLPRPPARGVAGWLLAACLFRLAAVCPGYGWVLPPVVVGVAGSAAVAWAAACGSLRARCPRGAVVPPPPAAVFRGPWPRPSRCRPVPVFASWGSRAGRLDVARPGLTPLVAAVGSAAPALARQLAGRGVARGGARSRLVGLRAGARRGSPARARCSPSLMPCICLASAAWLC